MFAGRYENASDKRVSISVPATIRVNCGLCFHCRYGRRKNPAARIPWWKKIAIPIKKSGKKHRENIRGHKMTGNRMPVREKVSPSIPR